MPEEAQVMLPSYCNQRHVGRATSDVATRMNFLTQVWTLAKTFAYGVFHVRLQRCVDAVLGSKDDGL